MLWFNNVFLSGINTLDWNWNLNPYNRIFSCNKFFNYYLPFQSSENLFSPLFNRTKNKQVASNNQRSYQQYPLSQSDTQLFSFNKNKTKTDNFTYQENYLNVPKAGSLNMTMVSTAKNYVGKVNSSSEGNRLFSPKGYRNTQWYKKYSRWGWCCDFAVHCAQNALGDKYPKDMITSSPEKLATAAEENHNAYLQVPSSNKTSWLKNNVNRGDIIYMKGSGDSGKHIAIVDRIGENGEIHAISGNSGGGKVREVDYNINTTKIYGFISLDRLAA